MWMAQHKFLALPLFHFRVAVMTLDYRAGLAAAVLLNSAATKPPERSMPRPSLPILPLLATLCTTACATPRTVVVRVPVPVTTPPCVMWRAPVPPAGMVVGSSAEVAWLEAWAKWTAYVEAACRTETRPEWRS